MMIKPAPTPDLELLGKPEPLVFVTEANRHNVLNRPLFAGG